MHYSQIAKPTFRGHATNSSYHAVVAPTEAGDMDMRIEQRFDSDEFLTQVCRHSNYDDNRRHRKYSLTKAQKRAAGAERRARRNREAQRAGTDPAPSLRQIYARLTGKEDMDQPMDLSAHRGPLPEIGYLAREKLGLRRVDIQFWPGCHHTVSVAGVHLRRRCSPVIRVGFTIGLAYRQRLPVTEHRPSA